jgi:GNAT superfamily N-acetyltransferase
MDRAVGDGHAEPDVSAVFERDADPAGEEMKIEHIKSIFNTDVLRQGLLATAELIEDGSTDGLSFPFSDEAEAHFVREDGKIIAMIVWKSYNNAMSAWISMAWVAKHRRRQGLYRALFEAVCAECRARKFIELEGFVYAGNSAMEATAIAMGRKPSRTVYAIKFAYDAPEESPVLP